MVPQTTSQDEWKGRQIPHLRSTLVKDTTGEAEAYPTPDTSVSDTTGEAEAYPTPGTTEKETGWTPERNRIWWL